MKPDDERFTAKTTVLIENVTHHMEEEEQDWFPKVRGGLGRKVLQEIGADMIEGQEEGAAPPVAAQRAQEDRRRHAEVGPGRRTSGRDGQSEVVSGLVGELADAFFLEASTQPLLMDRLIPPSP